MQERYTYASTPFAVQKRDKGWYYAQSARRHRAEDWRGPYRSEASVSLVFARELRREIVERHRAQTNTVAPRSAAP